MLNIEICNNGILKKHYALSTWVGGPIYWHITRLRMTDGANGKPWFEYVRRLDLLRNPPPANAIVHMTRYDGKDIFVNTSYIVEAENFTLALAQLDISKWKISQEDRRLDNIQNYYVLLEDNINLILE